MSLWPWKKSKAHADKKPEQPPTRPTHLEIKAMEQAISFYIIDNGSKSVYNSEADGQSFQFTNEQVAYYEKATRGRKHDEMRKALEELWKE